MRKPMVAGNWKMNASRCEAISLAEAIKNNGKKFAEIELVLIPSFVHLQQMEKILVDSKISWGAQNFYPGDSGAFTGEVSGPMLVDYGCQYVLVGHSERRTLFHEDLPLISAKFNSALKYGLKPILCIGETLTQRENNQTEAVIQEQLLSVINNSTINTFQQAVIAYEPVWAIGTGRTASPEQAQEVHHFIRKIIAKHSQEIADSLRILYGGSVKGDNAAGLFAKPDIDGALVGGASLEAKSFLTICDAANAILEHS